jgi:hypothetical protein
MGEAKRRREAGEISGDRLLLATRARPVTFAEMPEMTFEIVESPSLEYPFRIKRTEANGRSVYFQCRTADEAHAKLRAINTVLREQGHPVEVV